MTYAEKLFARTSLPYLVCSVAQGHSQGDPSKLCSALRGLKELHTSSTATGIQRNAIVVAIAECLAVRHTDWARVFSKPRPPRWQGQPHHEESLVDSPNDALRFAARPLLKDYIPMTIALALVLLNGRKKDFNGQENDEIFSHHFFDTDTGDSNVVEAPKSDPLITAWMGRLNIVSLKSTKPARFRLARKDANTILAAIILMPTIELMVDLGGPLGFGSVVSSEVDPLIDGEAELAYELSKQMAKARGK